MKTAATKTTSSETASSRRWELKRTPLPAEWMDFRTPGLSEDNCIEWTHYFAAEEAQCGRMRVRPGNTFTYHRHLPAEVYFPTKGSCSLLLDGQVIQLSADSCEGVFIPSNVPHGILNDSDEDYEQIWFYIRNGAAAGEVNDAAGVENDAAAGETMSKAKKGDEIVNMKFKTEKNLANCKEFNSLSGEGRSKESMVDGRTMGPGISITFLRFPSSEVNEQTFKCQN